MSARVVAEVENACFLNHLPGELPEECTRLYFGAEFCYWRLPSAEQIITAREWARDRSCSFTLVLPVIAESERRLLDDLLSRVLPACNIGDEVVLSDWGALDLIDKYRDDLVKIVGRTLSGQKRGPRINDLPLTPEQKHYFKCGSWHNQEAVKLLQELGIYRIEQDNLLQGLAPLPEGLSGSLHIPYAMVTSSRNCPFRGIGETGPCPAPCGKVFTLQTPETDQLLFQDGNAQFIDIAKLPEDLDSLSVDRIVRHPVFE